MATRKDDDVINPQDIDVLPDNQREVVLKFKEFAEYCLTTGLTNLEKGSVLSHLLITRKFVLRALNRATN